MVACVQRSMSSVRMPRKCTKAASVMAGWLHWPIKRALMPRMCTNAAPVSCVQLVIMEQLSAAQLRKGGVSEMPWQAATAQSLSTPARLRERSVREARARSRAD